MLTKPDITNIMDNAIFGSHNLNIAQIEIPARSRLEHTPISQLKLDDKHDLILIGVVDKNNGQLHFVIGGKGHTLTAGDVLVVMGTTTEIRHFKEEVDDVETDKI